MHVDIQPFAEYAVAPYVGAWIETQLSDSEESLYKSHPTWVRGLKLSVDPDVVDDKLVAPYVGAWIETS